jgi:hypothetical protein
MDGYGTARSDELIVAVHRDSCYFATGLYDQSCGKAVRPRGAHKPHVDTVRAPRPIYLEPEPESLDSGPLTLSLYETSAVATAYPHDLVWNLKLTLLRDWCFPPMANIGSAKVSLTGSHYACAHRYAMWCQGYQCQHARAC